MRSLVPVLAVLLLPALASVAGAQDADPSGESEILARINAMRNAAQLGPLVRHDALDAAAWMHSGDMADHGELVHVSERTGTPADRVRQAGLSPRALAENVAFASDALEAHRQLVASEAHRANMLTPHFTHIGLAVVETESGVYVTEVFAHLAADEPAEAVEPEPAPAQPPAPSAPEALAPWVGEEGAADPEAPPAPAPGGEVQAEPLPEAQAERAPAIRAPAQPQAGQRRVAGYWVYSRGHWWYYPLPPDARPGQVLTPTHRASSPPAGVHRQPGYRVYQPHAGYRPGYRVYVAPRRAPAFGWSPRRHYWQWRYGR